jgi:hypothetical protein
MSKEIHSRILFIIVKHYLTSNEHYLFIIRSIFLSLITFVEYIDVNLAQREMTQIKTHR